MPNPTVRASTQEAIPIEDIRDDLVILKDGSAALILQISALNFDLLSQREQEALIFAYGSLLNSLSFSVQIFIRSQKKDITGYLGLLEKAKDNQKNPLLKKIIVDYQKFIKEVVTKTEILDKKFYLVIPFSSLELGIGAATKSLTTNLPFFKKSVPSQKLDLIEVSQKAQTSLIPKRDHLIRLFARLGLSARQLTTNELIYLFFRIYNPNAKGIEPTLTKEYLSPLTTSVLTPPKEEIAKTEKPETQNEKSETKAPQ